MMYLISFSLQLESTYTKCDSHSTLGSYFVNVLDWPSFKLQSAELNQRKIEAGSHVVTWSAICTWIIWIYDRVILAVNLRNSTERNSMQRKHWMDVDSLNLDYFLLVRFRDYVLCCQIALFKSFKSLRLQNPTTLQRPMFRFFNA